ncbi:K02A2.6-like, partial [Cordylochernes scorpioides]
MYKDNLQLPRSLQERHEPSQSDDHLPIERRLQEAIEAASSTSIAIPTPDSASYSTMINHELNIAAQSGKRRPHLETGEKVSIIDTNILLKILERCGIEYKVEETPSTKKRTRESPSDSTPRSHKTPRIEVVSQHNENDVSMNEVTEVPQETSAATPAQVNEEDIDEDGPWTKVTHAKKPRIPPVIAENVTDWKLLCQELKDLCTDKFQCTISGNKHIIKTKNISDFKKIREYVQKNNGGYSYRLQEEKPLKVVLKGVTTAYKTEDIAIELETMGFAETSVKRLHRQSTKRPMNLVLVELPKNEQNKKIYGITELLYQKIAVESFRTTNRVTQCFNCQGFGHGQLNCFLKPKCVKCAEEHHSKDCPRKSRQLPPKCANCEEAHTANYRGCPKFPRVHQQQPRYPGQYKPNNPLPISERSETLPKIVEQQNQSNAEVATRKTSRSETKDLCEKLMQIYSLEESLIELKLVFLENQPTQAPKHFDPNRERWEDWLQQYSWYETATEMKKKKPEVQVASFMTIIGSDAQKIYRTFVLSPEETKKVEEIKKRFTNYFLPKNNYTMERYNFNKLQQSMVETITEFITRLRLQASKCKFESLEDELIKDRVVVGIHDDHTREKLLSDPDLDLDKAIQICMAAERTNKEIKVMQQHSDQEVSVIKKNFRPKKNVTMEEVPKLIDNCKKCGGTHPIRRCPAYGKICNKCKKANHFAKCCRSNFRYKKKINTLEEETENDEFSLQINSLSEFTSEPMEIIQINNTEPFKIKLDTGAQCNVLPWNIFKKINSKLNRSSVKSLKSFSGHRIKVEGEIIASCIINNIKADIKFIVTKTGTTPILGSESCFMLGLLKRINEIKPVEQEFHQLFNGDGCLKNFEYRAEFTKGDHKLEIKPPRRIPLKIKDEVKKQLDLMEKSKVIKRMEEPTPVSSHMVVVKQGGKYRICIDPSDLNKILLRRHYPLRTIEDIASNIKNSKYFTKLDFLKGFWQLKVAAETQPFMTFSTPWGRYAFLRVPFGIKTAPEIFQNTISKIVENIPGVENSMDDILIHAEDIQTLRERTKIVMTTLQEAGARLNKDKCEFEKTKIKFLGHIFTSDGIKTDEEKVKAIDNIKSASNKKELQRLLGMVQYLHKFIPNLSEITYRMRLLLKKNTEWQWDSLMDKDMERIKDLLKQAPTLKYYDPNKDVVLSVDASQHAIGAVLLQEDRPIAYASSALNDAQRHYPQIEKEALAIKFGCKKFHTYIYGKSLLIETDHRPLESIYKKPMDKMPPRLQKIFMEINQYGPNIKYKSGKELLIADLLSRDCKSYEILEENPIEILLITAFDNRSTTNIMKATKEDAELQELKETIIQGWPDQKSLVPLSCRRYWNIKDELSIHEDLVLRGTKIIIPESIKKQVLKQIHEGHLGITGCTKRAKDSIYWAGMSKDISEMTSSPHYPKSNGLAERAVQIAKNILRKCKQSGDDIQIALLNYRNTPREDMGSPAQRLLSRRTKTILPISKELLRPCIQKDVTLKLRRSRNKQKFYYDKGSRDEPTFKIGQEVYLRENRRNWKPATIVREDGPRSYTVQNNKGLYRRNQSHITTNQSQRDHESILEQEPSGSACSTLEQDQETQPKGSDRMELQSKLIIQLERRRPERCGSSQEAVARRLMLSEVPSMCISTVGIHNNTSIIPEEQLAHRFGLLPIKVDPKLFEFKRNKEDLEENPEDTIKFELKIDQPIKGKTIDVLSGHIVWRPIGSQQQIHNNIKFVDDNILVAKLGMGHSLNVTMYATKGIGKENSKFSPVGTAFYTCVPEITLKSPIEGEDAHLLKKCFSEGVIEIENNGDKDVAVVKCPYLDSCSRNHMMYPQLAQKVDVRMKADYFMFTVESLGAIPSSDIFLEAISVLSTKA